MKPRSRIVVLLSLAIVLSSSLAAFGATPIAVVAPFVRGAQPVRKRGARRSRAGARASQ